MATKRPYQRPHSAFKKQKGINTRIWFKRASWGLYIALALYAGHLMSNDAKLAHAQAVCVHQTEYTTPSYSQCINNQLEVNNDH